MSNGQRREVILKLEGRGKYRAKTFVKNMRDLGISRRTNRIVDLAMDVGEVGARQQAAAAGINTYNMRGQGAYSARRTLTGRGAYQAPLVNSSDLQMGTRFSAPLFAAGPGGHDDASMVLCHQEFVQNVYGNSVGESFSSFSFDINPGLASVMPLLSQIAGAFQKYRALQIAFHFESQLDATVIQSATGQVGDILMYSHTDITSDDFQNPSEFRMNGGTSARITKGLLCGVECDPAQLEGLPNGGLNYVRTGPITDAEQYDQGRFQFAISNTPDELADQIIGRLYVSYSIELVKPRIWPLVGRSQLVDQFLFARQQSTYDNTYAPTMGDVWYGLSVNNIGCLIAYTEPTSSTAESVSITLPSWLQGCVRVELYSNADKAGAPDATHIYGADVWIGTGISGEVKLVDMEPQLANDLSLTNATYTYMNSIGEFDADSQLGLVATYVRQFRASPALTENNVITLSSNVTDNWNGEVFPATLRGTLKISIVNDYGAVGTQHINDKSTLVAI